MTSFDSNTLYPVRMTKTYCSFNGNHPNGINVGYVREGFMHRVPAIGEEFCIWPGKRRTFSDTWRVFRTSLVTEVKKGEIVTENGIYKLEVESLEPDGVPVYELFDPEKIVGRKPNSEE